MEKNEKRVIAITIENTMNVPFDKLLNQECKGFKDWGNQDQSIISSKRTIGVWSEIESGDKVRQIDVIFEFYSFKVVVDCNILTVKIKLTDDADDKDLNK